MEKPTPNVEMIRAEGMRIIRGSIPRAVRKELYAAVKAGQLGRFKKDKLLPEVFYHPDQFHAAKEKRQGEAMHSIECIKKVIAP